MGNCFATDQKVQKNQKRTSLGVDASVDTSSDALERRSSRAGSQYRGKTLEKTTEACEPKGTPSDEGVQDLQDGTGVDRQKAGDDLSPPQGMPEAVRSILFGLWQMEQHIDGLEQRVLSELRQRQDLFRSLDRNEDHLITGPEFSEAIKAMHPELHPNEISLLFTVLDRNRDGFVSLVEVGGLRLPAPEGPGC
jgi:hypothetical protein